MRPPLVLLVALLVLSGCGTTATSGEAATVGTGEAMTASTTGPRPSIRIEIDEAPPAAAPLVATAPASDGSGTEGSVAPGTGAGAAPPTPLPAGTARASVVAEAVVPRITARVAPSDDAAPVTTLAHPTAVGSPLVFLAVEGAAPAGWLEVRLPIQPNGSTGWVRRDEVTLSENPYRIEIDRASHRLQVFHLGQPWLDTTIAVGTGATPTPVGEFYLLELLAPPDPTGPYGPYAFGLSGFSEVLDSFGGADVAIIGLHGTDQPEALGTDVSFGCIRLANDVMSQLATTLPLGTPVRIV